MPFAWVVVAGAFMQLYAARLAYAAGSLAKTYILVVQGAFWVAWATLIMDGKQQGDKKIQLNTL